MTDVKLSHGGTFPPRRRLPVLVAPTVDGTLSNTLRSRLDAVACFAIAAPGFDFDSSLLMPSMRGEFDKLAQLLARLPDHPVSLFAHADPIGADDYNKALAGRRAQSVYALLTRRDDLWESLWTTGSKACGDAWDLRHILVMLGALTAPATGLPYFAGQPSTRANARSDAAVRAFQGDHGLSVDGDVGPKTRSRLFRRYMDLLAGASDGVDGLFVAPASFLGKGGDPGGKADYQSCGEFNPAMVLSKREAAMLAREERDAENTANRRVIVYVFATGTTVDPGRWPCPTVQEPTAGCRKRFWSDAAARRAPAETRRSFDESQDTFACRFYHRIAGGSPCERPTSLPYSIEIYFDLPVALEAVTQTFTLVSTDNTYAQTAPVSAASRVNEALLALRFTDVRGGKLYSLYHDLGAGALVPIFVAVPLAAIDDFGADTPAPAPQVFGQFAAAEARVNENAQHPMLAHHPADVRDDPGWYDPDPGTAVA